MNILWPRVGILYMAQGYAESAAVQYRQTATAGVLLVESAQDTQTMLCRDSAWHRNVACPVRSNARRGQHEDWGVRALLALCDSNTAGPAAMSSRAPGRC